MRLKINRGAAIRKKRDWKYFFVNRILMNWQVYIMILPVVIFYALFNYAPMYGIALAFKDYLPNKGILGSDNVGWENFRLLFANPQFGRAIRNTLVISALKLVFFFPVPIVLSLLLNEMHHAKFKKSIQTAIYLPNFISWVIIGGLVRQLLATSGGMVNNIITALGGKNIPFLTTSAYFYPILILCEIWHGAGWGTIIYIAALSGVSPTFYEAATIDGAKRLRLMWSISLPCILPVIIVMLLMQIGNVMNAGFDPVFNLYNTTVLNVADIIDTLVYRLGLGDTNYEQSTALGLFKNVINFVLLIGANVFAKKLSGYSMYSFD